MMIQSTLNQQRLNKGSYTVLRALKEIGKLSSAQDIHLWFRLNETADAPALTTIYRALDSLLKMNLLQAVDIGDGERRYEIIEPGQHHHHLICTNCLESVHLDQCFLETFASKVEQRHGFVVRSHVLEIFGICSKCASKGAAR